MAYTRCGPLTIRLRDRSMLGTPRLAPSRKQVLALHGYITFHFSGSIPLPQSQQDPTAPQPLEDLAGLRARSLANLPAYPNSTSQLPALPTSAYAHKARVCFCFVSFTGVANSRLLHLRAPPQRRCRYCPIRFIWPVRIRRLNRFSGAELVVAEKCNCLVYLLSDWQC